MQLDLGKHVEVSSKEVTARFTIDVTSGGVPNWKIEFSGEIVGSYSYAGFVGSPTGFNNLWEDINRNTSLLNGLPDTFLARFFYALSEISGMAKEEMEKQQEAMT